MSKIIGLLLLFSLLFSGCSPLPSVTTPLAPTFTPIPPASPPVSKPTAIPLSLKPCIVANGAVKAECGELLVPKDRTNPNSRILHLGIVVVRAREANPEPDPLFYIAGGPGNADTDAGIVYGVTNLFREVNARRDVVFLDQRGTNGQHKLTCQFPSFQIADAFQQEVNDWMKTCLATLAGDPRFYTTVPAMQDLDDARAALGYDKINLFGISYGVAAEQVYMRMFPEHVRTVVMDHGTALDLPFWEVMPRASQYALDQVLSYCELDEKCHAAYLDIRRDWMNVLDRLAKGPVTLDYIPPGADAPAAVAMDDFVLAIHDLMYKSGTYVYIPSLVHALATNEDWTAIAKNFSAQHPDSAGDKELLLMQYMIFCFEPAWGIPPDDTARFSPGSYYLQLEMESIQFDQKLCAALPKPDASLIYGPGKPAPLSALMFNSLIDPQNPPFHMDLALQEFTKSRVVVEPTEGHDTSASACRWDIVAQYIEQGSVDGLDISCMEKQKPSFVIRDWK